MEPVDIKKLDVKELKSMAYDALATIDQAQRNLKALNEEIYLRTQQDKANANE